MVDDVCSHVAVRQRIDALGVTIHERAGTARFVDPHTIDTESGLRLEADKIIICTGGVNRRLPIPGFELTSTHSDAWSLTSVPPSMLVVGGGRTGAAGRLDLQRLGYTSPGPRGGPAHTAACG